MSRWRRTARAGCCRWPTISSRCSPSSCLPRRRAATSTRRFFPARRSNGCARPLREKVPKLEEDRHLHPDIEAAIELVRSGAIVDAVGAELLPGSPERMTDRRDPRGDAPLLVSMPHTGTEIPPDIEADSSRRGSRARTPTGGSSGSTISPAISARPCPHHAVAHRHRREPRSLRRLALSGPGTTALPDRDVRRRAALQAGREPTRTRSTRAAAVYFDPYHAALVRRDGAAARSRIARVVLYDCHSIRSVIPRLFDGELPHINLGTNRRQVCDSGAAHVVAADLPTPPACSWSRQRPLQGRLDHAQLTGGRRRRARASQMELACRPIATSRPGDRSEELAAGRTTPGQAEPRSRDVLQRNSSPALSYRTGSVAGSDRPVERCRRTSMHDPHRQRPKHPRAARHASSPPRAG